MYTDRILLGEFLAIASTIYKTVVFVSSISHDIVDCLSFHCFIPVETQAKSVYKLVSLYS